MVDISKMIVPALVTGILMAGLTGLINATIGICNIMCCLWLMGGGALAAYMLQRSVGEIELKDGAVVGALSGVVFAVLTIIFAALLLLLGFGVAMASMQQAFDQAGVESGLLGASLLIGLIIAFVIYLIWGLIFCTIGGVIAAKLLEKK